jgi:hypothetical protein
VLGYPCKACNPCRLMVFFGLFWNRLANFIGEYSFGIGEAFRLSPLQTSLILLF